jgi:hypothetical protein
VKKGRRFCLARLKVRLGKGASNVSEAVSPGLPRVAGALRVEEDMSEWKDRLGGNMA